MLFDLRGRGRRRTVQAIYLTLALLMGGGLVLFGVGGNTSGGLLDAFKNDANSGGGGDIVAKQLKAAEKRVQLNPRDAVAWAAVAKYRFQEAGNNGYDRNTSEYTDKGKQELASAGAAWERYLSLNPKPVDLTVANVMVQAYGAIGEKDKAVNAYETIVDATDKPTAGQYVQLAQLAYAAGQTRKGDLASGKAVAMTPKAQRKDLQTQLKALKSSAQGTTPQGGSSAQTVPVG